MCPGVSGGTPYLFAAPWAQGPSAALAFGRLLGPPWVALDALLALLGSPGVHFWHTFCRPKIHKKSDSSKSRPKSKKLSPGHQNVDSSRSAHARRPSLFSPAKAAPSPNFRDAPMSLLQGADPFGGTQGGEDWVRETKGTQRGPWGDGPMGPFGVIPKLFRMESHFEWSLNCAGKRTLISRWGQIVPTSRNGPKWSNMVSKLTIWSIWATMGPK